MLNNDPKRNEQDVRLLFQRTAIMEILELCSNEFGEEGRSFESIWTMDGV